MFNSGPSDVRELDIHYRTLGKVSILFCDEFAVPDFLCRQSRPFPDPLVKVYDIRTMRALPPIPFSSNPAFIHVLPKRSSSIAVVSNQGLIHIMDTSNLSAPNEFHQVCHSERAQLLDSLIPDS